VSMGNSKDIYENEDLKSCLVKLVEVLLISR
jgi:hypothetical protein